MTRVRTLRAFKFWSNIFYVVPLVLAVQWNLWPTAILVVAVVFFGTPYHFANEKHFFWPDSIAACLLIASNLVLCYLGNFTTPYFWIACLFLALSLFYHFYLQSRGQYSLNHGLWHLYGALITLFCIFTYVF